MAEYKLSIANPKEGKTYKKDLSAEESVVFKGKTVGDKIKGDGFGYSGYEFEITGGSDSCGFPMRKDVAGPSRKKVLIVGGVGLRNKRKGMRKRKTVAGNTVSDTTAQINLKVIKAGKTPLGGVAEAPAEAGEAAEKPAEKKE